MLEQFKKQMVSDVIRYGQMGFKFIESEHPRNESGEFSSGGKSGIDNVSADDTIREVSGVNSEASKKGEKMAKEPHEKTRQEWDDETGIPAHDWRALEDSGVADKRRAAVTAAKEAGKSIPREVMEDYPSMFHLELEKLRARDKKDNPPQKPPKEPAVYFAPRPKGARLASRLPKRNSPDAQIITHGHAKAMIRAKFVPREPREGEFLMLVNRPQSIGTGGTGGFPEFANGDYLDMRAEPHGKSTADFVPPDGKAEDLDTKAGRDIAADYWDDHGSPNKAAALRRSHYVVTAAGGGYTRAGEGYKKWEQFLVVRLASKDDRDAIKDQIEADEKETQRVMDGMMSS